MIAPDRITATIGGERVRLSPTLRAAIRLQRKHGLPALLAGIESRSLTILDDILAETSTCPVCLDRAIETHGLDHVLAALVEPCEAVVIQIYGLERRSEPTTIAEGESRPDAKPITEAEVFEALYERGTGWIGWTPLQTLDASPAEIIAATKGRQELIGGILTAVFRPPKKAGDQSDAQDASADYEASLARDPDASATLRDLRNAFGSPSPKVAEPPPPPPPPPPTSPLVGRDPHGIKHVREVMG